MHALLGALASALLFAGLVSAADDKATHPGQRQHTKECTAQAGEKHLTGDARKEFMAECLKGHEGSEESLKTEKNSHSGKSLDGEHRNAQGQKMKMCNQEASAKNLRGDDRRQFMSQCLKAEKKS
jgi:psiF repeat